YLAVRFRVPSPRLGEVCPEPFDGAQEKLRRRDWGESSFPLPLRRLAQLIHQRTEGNPLFMVTMVDYLSAHGAITQTARQLAVQEAAAETAAEVPETLRQTIERQLERLGLKERRLLEAASVVGTEFSAAAVAAGSGRAPEEVEEECEELARRGQFLRVY